MQKLGRVAEIVSLTDLLTPPTYVEAEVRCVCKPALPPQMSSSLSARLTLVPRMEGCEFLDLINNVVQPLSVLTLKGVQFGQAGLHWYSHLVWCPGRGCSPFVILINWRFSVQMHWLHRGALVLR